MNCIRECDNCKRAITNISDESMVCNVGNKNKLLYNPDGNPKYTENWYWCKGKYQQQIGIEGRQL